MSATTLEIRSCLKMQFAQQHRITERIQEGLAQRGEFVSDEEMETFFAHFAELGVEVLLIEECEKRAAAIDHGEMALVSVDEVMLKYRQ